MPDSSVSLNGDWPDKVIVSEPVTFIAGNGPIIVRPEGMSDEDWQEIVDREIEARRA